MRLTDQLLIVSRTYCAAAEVDMARASLLSLGDRRLLVRLESGLSSMTLARADIAIAWFSRNWPAEVDWPASAPRPDQPDERGAA